MQASQLLTWDNPDLNSLSSHLTSLNSHTHTPTPISTMFNCEDIWLYRSGGFHLVHLGDKFHNNRYVIEPRLQTSTVALNVDAAIQQCLETADLEVWGPRKLLHHIFSGLYIFNLLMFEHGSLVDVATRFSRLQDPWWHMERPREVAHQICARGGGSGYWSPKGIPSNEAPNLVG